MKKKNILKKALVISTVINGLLYLIAIFVVFIIIALDQKVNFDFAISLFIKECIPFLLLFILVFSYQCKKEILRWCKEEMGIEKTSKVYGSFLPGKTLKFLENHKNELNKEDFNDFKKAFLWF